jgi:hypothetical protein
MRAKNEFKFLAEAYDTKLILERVVDGKLMCPEACCGSPVMECKCGPDCEHCNCHEIQKLAKKEEDEESLAESKWETARDVAGAVTRAGWELGKGAARAGFEVGKYGAEKGYKAYKKRKHGKSAKGMAEKNEKEIREIEQKEADRDRLVKSRQRLKELKGEDDTDKGQYAFEDAEDLSGGWESSRDRAGEMEAKEEAMRKKIERIIAKRKDKELPVGHYEHMVRLTKNYPDDDPWSQGSVQVRKTDKELIQKFLDKGYRIVKPEDNEEPKRGITGHQHTDALAQAALSKDYKHKPYVSSYVGGESDGFRKIFAVLGSDGKIVHKTRDKREAHQWLKDNYENI